MKLITNQHTGRQVLINTIRDNRKDDFSNNSKDECPFCPEYALDLKCLRYEQQVEDTWVVRSIDNKFPALLCDETLHDQGEIDYGKHEVMIECREHDRDYFDFDDLDFQHVLQMYHERFRALYDEDKIKSVMIYKNHLKSAGASKRHSHSQILSMSFVPPEIEKELMMIKKGKLTKNENIIFEDEIFQSYMPEDAFLSGEIILTHKKNQRFEAITKEEIKALSKHLEQIFQGIETIYGKIPFNMYVHSLPKDYEMEAFRWHLHIIPRKGQFGGFELSTGLYINSLEIKEVIDRFAEN